MVTKKCSKCKGVKPLSEFRKRAAARDGLDYVCDRCKLDYKRNRYQNDPVHRAKVLATQAARNAANPERNRAKVRAWTQANPERVVEYRAATKDRRREVKAAWDAANREHVRAKAAAHYAANKEQASLTNKMWMANNAERRRVTAERWRLANLHKVCEHSMRHRAQKITSTPKWCTVEELRLIYKKAREWNMHVDHIVPLRSKLVCGLHVPDNLQLLVRSENSRKSNRTWPDMPE